MIEIIGSNNNRGTEIGEVVIQPKDLHTILHVGEYFVIDYMSEYVEIQFKGKVYSIDIGKHLTNMSLEEREIWNELNKEEQTAVLENICLTREEYESTGTYAVIGDVLTNILYDIDSVINKLIIEHIEVSVLQQLLNVKVEVESSLNPDNRGVSTPHNEITTSQEFVSTDTAMIQGVHDAIKALDIDDGMVVIAPPSTNVKITYVNGRVVYIDVLDMLEETYSINDITAILINYILSTTLDNVVTRRDDGKIDTRVKVL